MPRNAINVVIEVYGSKELLSYVFVFVQFYFYP